jgi:hypothetical protein
MLDSKNGSRSRVFLKFLKKIVIMNPMQNSRPAKAKNRNVVDNNIKSSIIIPTTAV